VAVEIVMPRLSDSMEEGTILQWLVSQGDEVAEGEPLVEVETDKASVTYESEYDGTLLAINAEVGASVAVGAVIAVIGESGESVAVAGAGAGEGDEAGATATAATVAVAAPPAAPASPAVTAAPAASSSPPAVDRPGRVKASPLARRIAAELGVDLGTLAGSGPQGRVIRADVERSAADVAATGPAASATSALAARTAKGDTTREELTRLQRTVARRMAESRATVPDFELRSEVDMTRAVALREQLRELSDAPPSYNDFIVRAAALALREFPRVNGSYQEAAFERYSRVNIGIAVAAEDALVVPTIFDADVKTMAEIAAEARRLAGRVRDGSISPSELGGGTFSVSNLGMYGLDSFSAVINPPQAAMLAVGSLKPRAVVDESGAVVARPTIKLTLACDHRILYGADGARFLARLRELLEKPVSLLV
jgi:pyruvate dehydrogenase E2 component (dihydrolipoamide acetyltransferase)